MLLSLPTADLFLLIQTLCWFDREGFFLGAFEVLEDEGVSFTGERKSLGRPLEPTLFDGQNCRVSFHAGSPRLPLGDGIAAHRMVDAPLFAELHTEPVLTLSGELLYKRLSVLDVHDGTVLRRKPNPELGISEFIISCGKEIDFESDDPKIFKAIEFFKKSLEQPMKVLRQHPPHEHRGYSYELYSPDGGDPVNLLRAILRVCPEVIMPFHWDADSFNPVQSSRRTIPLDRSHLVHPRTFERVNWDELLRLAAFYPAELLYDEEVIGRFKDSAEPSPDLQMTFDLYASIETNDRAVVEALHGLEYIAPLIEE